MLAEPLLSEYHDSPRRRSRSARAGHREFLLVGLGLGLGLLAAGPRAADADPARHAFTVLMAVALLGLGLRLLALRRRLPLPAETMPIAAAYAVAPLAPPPAAPPTNVLVLSVNGATHSLRDPSPSLLLSDWLRSLGLTGTKIGCGEGGCGACTVIVMGSDSVPRVINACLRLLCACDGLAITTVEGLGSHDKGFSPAMAAIAHGQGSQCGFCTPGWVAAMTGLLAAHAQRGGAGGISPKEIERALDGNLCRCTGYRPILQAFKEAFGSVDGQPAAADGCCGGGNKGAHSTGDGSAAASNGQEHLAHVDVEAPSGRESTPAGDIEDGAPCHDVRTMSPCGRKCDEEMRRRYGVSRAIAASYTDPGGVAAQALAVVAAPRPVSLRARAPPALNFEAAHGMRYRRPTSLPGLAAALQASPTARLVCANTGMGVGKYYTEGGPAAGGMPPQQDSDLVDVSAVPEIAAAPVLSAASLSAGAAVPIDSLRSALAAAAAASEAAAPIALALERHLGRVATTQVRSVGSWAGNLALARAHPSLPSDIATLLVGCDATLHLWQAGAAAAVPVAAYLAAGPGARLIPSHTAIGLSPGQSGARLSFPDQDAAGLSPGQNGALVSCGQSAVLVSSKHTGSAPPPLVILSMTLPLTFPGQTGPNVPNGPAPPPSRGKAAAEVFCYVDKVSTRHANSHALLNICLCLRADPGGGSVAAGRGAVGGLVSTGTWLVPPAVFAPLLGRPLRDETGGDGTGLRGFLSALSRAADAAMAADPAPPAGMAPLPPESVRRSLLCSFGYKAVLAAIQGGEGGLPPPLASAVAGSLGAADDRPVSKGVQSIRVSDDTMEPISLPMPKLTSLLQASGEALYSSDTPPSPRQLYGAFVLTPDACAGRVLVEADFTRTLSSPGVVDVLTCADFPDPSFNATAAHDSDTGPFYLLPTGQPCPYVGAPVAVVLADSLPHARRAAQLAALTLAPRATPDVLATMPSPFGSPAHPAHAASALRRLSGRSFASRNGLDLSLLQQQTEMAHRRAARAVAPAGGDETDGTDGTDGTDATGGSGLPVTDEAGHASIVVGRPVSEWWGAAEAEGKMLVEGSFGIGGQRHFYLETHAAHAAPVEGGGLRVTCGHQNPALTQTTVASAVALPAARVDIILRRVGGAYGGKLQAHLPTVVAAALAATKHRVAVLMHNERADDMTATGGRPPMQGQYKLAVSPSGIVPSMELRMVWDSGAADAAAGDVAMGVAWSDNAYSAPDFSVHGSFTHSACPGTTACRAPGVMQSIPLHEMAMEVAAEVAGLPPDLVREANMYKLGDQALGGVVIGARGYDWRLPEMWASAKAAWDVDSRRTAVAEFNTRNRWRKRGLALIPTKYGIGVSATDYHEGCTLGVMPDGSVLIRHGGCEVGQGIHTKAAQAASFALGCPLSLISVGDTSSLASPGSLATGGSATSECVVKAVLDAAATLAARLQPFRFPPPIAGQNEGPAQAPPPAPTSPSGTPEPPTQMEWVAAVAAASAASVELQATGWFGGASAGDGVMFDYSTQGVACCQVEVDCLTGEVAILRADLLMDQGTPLNPEIDLGQVEGGFVMALGLFFSEETERSPSGRDTRLGTWEYKVPAVHDIPLEFNVSFLPRAPNPAPNATLKSKACAEPPMALAMAAFLAVRSAIQAARAEAANPQPPLQLDAPLTPARVHAACLVDPAQFTLH